MARIIKAKRTAPPATAREAVANLDDLAAEARAVVLDARKEAARITAEARANADALAEQAAAKAYDTAFNRGREEGIEQGRTEGLEQARKEFADEAAGLTSLAEGIVRELSVARGQLIHHARCELLDLALAVARKVVGRVAARDPGVAEANLRKALDHVDARRDVIVRVNPEQEEGLRRCLPGLVDALGRSGEVRLVADEDVSAGGVVLRTAEGEVDATIETQIDSIVEALVGGCGCAAADAPPADATGRYEADAPAACRARPAGEPPRRTIPAPLPYAADTTMARSE